MITLFHGSDKIIERPYYGGSRDNNDYRNGFYCSESSGFAEEATVFCIGLLFFWRTANSRSRPNWPERL